MAYVQVINCVWKSNDCGMWKILQSQFFGWIFGWNWKWFLKWMVIRVEYWLEAVSSSDELQDEPKGSKSGQWSVLYLPSHFSHI